MAPRSVGRYVVHAELASGGMATVHLAKLQGQMGFSRTVAVKQLHAHYAKEPEFVAMLLDEARLAARIQHPNVVSPIDVVNEDGEISVVMEYVHGEPLHKLVRAIPTMDLPIVSAIVCGVLHGLHAAHEARDEKGEPLGIVHRDVSPQNIIVGVDGIARVLDFGIAKATGRLQTTRDGQIKGKLAYMAPEQCRGGEVSARTDVYAMGVILWELLTGRRLFKGENDASILEQVLLGIVKPPSRWVPSLTPALDEITMQALERDPQRRFASAHDMAVALERVVPPAPPRVLGALVASTAKETLAQRSALLAEIESSGSQPAVSEAKAQTVLENEGTATMQQELPEPLRARRQWLAVAVVLILLVASSLVGVAMLRTKKEPPPAPSPPIVVVSAPVESAAPVVSTTPSASVVVAKPSAIAKPKPPPPKPAAGCDPPYYYDASYKKHWKPQCI